MAKTLEEIEAERGLDDIKSYQKVEDIRLQEDNTVQFLSNEQWSDICQLKEINNTETKDHIFIDGADDKLISIRNAVDRYYLGDRWVVDKQYEDGLLQSLVITINHNDIDDIIVSNIRDNDDNVVDKVESLDINLSRFKHCDLYVDNLDDKNISIDYDNIDKTKDYQSYISDSLKPLLILFGYITYLCWLYLADLYILDIIVSLVTLSNYETINQLNWFDGFANLSLLIILYIFIYIIGIKSYNKRERMKNSGGIRIKRDTKEPVEYGDLNIIGKLIVLPFNSIIKILFNISGLIKEYNKETYTLYNYRS